jgi:hypothetical protein
MGAQRPTKTEGQPAEWVEGSATAYVIDPRDELPLEQGVRPDLPQFTSGGLSPSFLGELHLVLQKRTAIEAAEEYQEGRVARENAVRRVAHAIPIPHEYSVQLYVCSEEFCRLLAALDDTHIADIALRWRALLWPSLHQNGSVPESLNSPRASILPQLVTLSKVAMSTGRKLMLRIEYRRNTRDATTGVIHRSQETRH